MTGYPKNTSVVITLRDGTTMTDVAWSTISERKIVKYLDQSKIVYACTVPMISSVEVFLNELSASVDVVDGDEVYIAIRSEMFAAQDTTTNNVIGKTVGIIRDGIVVEEKYINALENRVEGFRN